MKRIGEMIRVKPEGKQAYIDWHANPLPGVNEMIKECNIQNYSIYSRGDYLFAYYEYVGDDFEADMAKMAAQLSGGNGGGRPDLAQSGGKDISNINDVLAQIREKL